MERAIIGLLIQSVQKWKLIMSLNVPKIPSLSIELLNKLRGKYIVKLIRYSWWPKQDVPTECSIEREKAFSLTAGPLAIVLNDGKIIGVSSDPSLNSILVWQEEPREDKLNSLSLAGDDELFPVLNNDDIYSSFFWAQLSGLTIESFSILKKHSMTVLESSRPSEIGLRFILGNGMSFLASHGLHDGSDDFSIIVDDKILDQDGIEEMVLI